MISNTLFSVIQIIHKYDKYGIVAQSSEEEDGCYHCYSVLEPDMRFQIKPNLEPIIPGDSEEGRQFFLESLQQNVSTGFYADYDHVSTQLHPTWCALGSLTSALNTLKVDPLKTWQSPWRYPGVGRKRPKSLSDPQKH